MVEKKRGLKYAKIPGDLSLQALIQDDPVLGEAVDKAIKRGRVERLPEFDKVQAEVYHRGNTTVTILTVYPPLVKRLYAEPFLRGIGTAKRNPADRYSSTVGWVISMTRAIQDLSMEIRYLESVSKFVRK